MKKIVIAFFLSIIVTPAFAAKTAAASAPAPALTSDQPFYVGVTVGAGFSSAVGALFGYNFDDSTVPFMNTDSVLGKGILTAEVQVTSLNQVVNKSTSSTSIGVNAVARFPVNIPKVKNLSAFGKLGIASNSVNSSRTNVLTYGLGAQYELGKQLSVRAGYQSYGNLSTQIYAAALYNF